MKVVVMLLLVVVLVGELILLARAPEDRKEEVGIAVNSEQEAAENILLDFLAFEVSSPYASDEEKREAKISQQASESYLQSQLEFDLTSTQDRLDMEKVRKAVAKYSRETARLKREWQANVISEPRRIELTQLLQKDCARSFHGTKAEKAVKKIADTPITPDQQ